MKRNDVKIVVTDNRELYEKKKKFLRGYALFFSFLFEDGKAHERWINFSLNYFLNIHKNGPGRIDYEQH